VIKITKEKEHTLTVCTRYVYVFMIERPNNQLLLQPQNKSIVELRKTHDDVEPRPYSIILSGRSHKCLGIC